MSDFPELTQAVIDGNRNKVVEVVNAELEKGTAPHTLRPQSLWQSNYSPHKIKFIDCYSRTKGI